MNQVSPENSQALDLQWRNAKFYPTNKDVDLSVGLFSFFEQKASQNLLISFFSRKKMEWRTLYGEDEGLCGCQMGNPQGKFLKPFQLCFLVC